MILGPKTIQSAFNGLGRRFLPFADAASDDLPLPRLLRLSLFQVTVGMAMVLLAGTLNRVMIIELGVPAWLVAVMVALPILFAPFRALIGHRSDIHRSVLGWRRVPYLWFGTLLQFGGFAIMPFALLLLSGDQMVGPSWAGEAGAALAFLMVGAGMHTTQTAGLALATDIAPEKDRPRVVALLYVMLMAGMVGAALIYGLLLRDFTPLRLIEVVQGTAAVTLVINLVALWGQEPRRPQLTNREGPRPSFLEEWRALTADGRAKRLLIAVGLGTAGFQMQDILLEPYGGEILGMSVSGTTFLTALMAGGALAAFGIAARALNRGYDPHGLAAIGVLVGFVAFLCVIFASPMESRSLFQTGATLIGFGGGLFAVGLLTAAMGLADTERTGIALGAWGAVQATASGVAIAIGGTIRDVVNAIAMRGWLGETMANPTTGYSVVYHIEMVLLIATFIVLLPLVRRRADSDKAKSRRFGLAEFPT